MANTPISKQRIIKGEKLTCIVCKHDTFWERETLIILCFEIGVFAIIF